MMKSHKRKISQRKKKMKMKKEKKVKKMKMRLMRRRKNKTSVVTPESKDKQKILLDEDSDKEDQDDDDAAIEEIINKITRTKGEKKRLKELITGIIVEELATTPLPTFATNKYPKKYPVKTPRVTSKRK